MKSVVTFGLVAVAGLTLSACGMGTSTKMIEIVQAEKAESIPDWYVNTPEDEEDAIFGSGTGLSTDLQFSMDKAMHQAKVVLGDKISNNVSAEMKSYIADNSAIGASMAVEETQKVSKSGYKNIDVSEYEVVDKTVTLEGISYRTYVLLSVDPAGRKKEAPSVTVEDVQSAQEKARAALDNL